MHRLVFDTHRQHWAAWLQMFALLGITGSPCFAEFGVNLLAELPGGDFSKEMYTQIERAPGRPNEVFVSRADGNIYRVDTISGQSDLFVSVPNVEVGGGYWGMLGFSFHPDFANNGQLFVHTADDYVGNSGTLHHTTYIRSYTLGNHLTNAPTIGNETNILSWDQPGPDHNGGWIGFHPDDPNTLWITSGDGQNRDAGGGSDRDPHRHGQNPHSLQATIMRIDISGSGAGPHGNYAIPADNPFADGVNGAPEVYAYGVRSPWGASFDRNTGDFYFGDVGSFRATFTSGIEEVNFIHNDSLGGQNFGWRVMEGESYCSGSQDAGDPVCGDSGFTPPLYEYEYGGQYGGGNADTFDGRSVTGGYVYRGPVKDLQGLYIFGDWSSRQIWGISVDRDANNSQGDWNARVDLSTEFERQLTGGFGAPGVTAFGEDQAGNLYFVELDGSIFKVVGDLVGDFNVDGTVDLVDYAIWRDTLGSTTQLEADANANLVIDQADYLLWRQAFGSIVDDSFAPITANLVPEPSSVALLLILFPFVASLLRFSRHSISGLQRAC